MAAGCAEIQYGGSGGSSGGAGGAGGAGGEAIGGTGGSGANGGTGGGATGGGGAAPGGELCLNGTDDDDDGLIDCADPECDAVGCADLPAGWLGPVVLSGDGDCAGDFANELLELIESVNADPASCTCACGAPSGACEDWVLRAYATPSCGGPSDAEQMAVGVCDGINAIVASEDAYRLESDNNAPGGSCPASVSASVPPADPITQRVCGAQAMAGGCSAGVCAPEPLCIYQAADSTCPTGFTKVLTGFETLTDTRSCTSGCGCAAPSGECQALVEIFGTNNCSGAVLTSAPDQACTAYTFSNLATYTALVTADVTAVGCNPVGSGFPTGMVTLSSPVTVCCSE